MDNGNGGRADVLAAVRAARRVMLVRSWPAGSARRFAIIGVVVVGLVVLGVSAFVRAAPRAEGPPPLPAAISSSSAAPSAAPWLVVSVVGKVHKAGLVRLADGARVADAIAAAGGALRGVDITTVNLARRISDGEQLFIGVPSPAWASAASAPDPSAGPAAAGPAGGKVNLNSATPAQLDQLPGVGTVTAQHIIDWRTAHGKFGSIDQLKDVEGIGDTRFGRLKDQVTVG